MRDALKRGEISMRFYSVGFFVLYFCLMAIQGCGGESADCKPFEDTYCDDSITYWVDSCGEYGDIKDQCECGCKADH